MGRGDGNGDGDKVGYTSSRHLLGYTSTAGAGTGSVISAHSVVYLFDTDTDTDSDGDLFIVNSPLPIVHRPLTYRVGRRVPSPPG